MKRDAVVIGAGPAGSTAALLLARQGWDVTVIEQHRFPRDKVCGECLSSLGITVLRRLDLLDGVSRLGAVQLTRANLHACDGDSATIALPRPMVGISRRAFDQYLLDAAAAAGARVRQPVRCESIGCATLPLLRLRDLTTNLTEELRSTYVIVADGKPLAVADTRGAPPTGDFGIKVHFEGVDGPRDAIELFGCAGSYGGLAAIEGERWNAAFSVSAARLRAHGGDIGKVFAELASENVTLAGRLRSARRVGPWLAGPLPRFPVRDSWQRGIIPIGNSAAALEPIGGEGMGLALRSAELATEMLIRDEPATLAAGLPCLIDTYRRLWRTRSAACRVAGIAAASPRLARIALPLIASGAELSESLLRMLGK